MSRRAALAALLLAALAGPARAEIGAVDVVPAATLLVPYFEVDTARSGIDTIVTVTNASETATLARVTLWTDMAVPVFAWDIYLTGYDQATIDLRLFFRGGLREVTAPANTDPSDEISPKGSASQDSSFGSCVGTLPIQPQLPPATRSELLLAFKGRASALLGDKCGGKSYGDDLVRGFVTIDATSSCTTKLPGDTGYFLSGGTGVASNRNVLTGHYELRHVTQNFAQQDPAVHLEASSSDPLTTNPMSVTFYRFRTGMSIDNRERLPSGWQAHYAARGNAPGTAALPWTTTDLLVWRDPGAAMEPFTCGVPNPPPFPLSTSPLVIYNESGSDSATVPGAFFPLAAARVSVGATPLLVPYPVGLMVIDFEQRQGHVTIVHTALGRFSTGASAFPVGSGL